MWMKAKILIADDEKEIRDIVKMLLEGEGYEVMAAADGQEALSLADASVDLYILDVNMPKLSGFGAAAEIRKHYYAPILFLTAYSGESDKVMGFSVGGDDYLVKPYDFQELLARIRCITRRPGNLEMSGDITFGDVTYHPAQKQLLCGSKTLVLSKREGALLEFLLRNPGQTLPRLMILSRVWGPNAEVEEGNLDNYIHFIRRRLRTVGSALTLRTVRGIGYCLEVSHD